MDVVRFMGSFCLRPEARSELPGMVQVLVDAAAQGNRSACASIYALLDEAWGSRAWTLQVPAIRLPVLRELRAYDLREDRIREPWHIDARYGAFFGSGDARLLDRIVALAQQESTHPLHQAADWSLSSICQQYPHVAKAAGAPCS
jgi:hypothetical protein